MGPFLAHTRHVHAPNVTPSRPRTALIDLLGDVDNQVHDGHIGCRYTERRRSQRPHRSSWRPMITRMNTNTTVAMKKSRHVGKRTLINRRGRGLSARKHPRLRGWFGASRWACLRRSTVREARSVGDKGAVLRFVVFKCSVTFHAS